MRNGYLNFIVITLLFTIAIPVSAAAVQIKLQCNVTSRITFSSGRIEEEKGTAMIEITDNGANKIIIISSALGSVNNISISASTKVRSGSITVDYSDENKWDIERLNEGDLESITSSSTHIIIDRNSGSLIVTKDTSFTKGANIQTATSGNCEKINTSVKKF